MMIQRPCGSWMTSKHIKLAESAGEQVCGQAPPEGKEKVKDGKAAAGSDQEEAREEKESRPSWPEMPMAGTKT